jgi:hypothetical protein
MTIKQGNRIWKNGHIALVLGLAKVILSLSHSGGAPRQQKVAFAASHSRNRSKSSFDGAQDDFSLVAVPRMG